MKRDRVSYENYYEQNEETCYVVTKKAKLTDYVKMGFGFYIGYNAAYFLFTGAAVILKNNIQKK